MPHQRGSPGSGVGGRGGAGGHRRHPYSEHSRGRGDTRGRVEGRGRGRGRGVGRGAGESREDRRRYHDDRPDQDFIPFSGRARGASKPRRMTKPWRGEGQSSADYSRRGRTVVSKKHTQSNSKPRQLPKRPLSGKQKDKRFVKAAKTGSNSEDDSGDAIAGYNYENDEGIDSDEADQSVEEYLMQGFDWSVADQDPDQKNGAHSGPVQLEPEPEPCTSMSGWGGALVYQKRGE